MITRVVSAIAVAILLLGAAVAHSHSLSTSYFFPHPHVAITVKWTSICNPGCQAMPPRYKVIAEPGDELIATLEMDIGASGVSQYRISLKFDEAVGDNELDLVSVDGFPTSPYGFDEYPAGVVVESTSSDAGLVHRFSGRVWRWGWQWRWLWPYFNGTVHNKVPIGTVRFRVNTPVVDGVDVVMFHGGTPQDPDFIMSNWFSRKYILAPPVAGSYAFKVMFGGASVGGTGVIDSDSDGISDAGDNCVSVANGPNAGPNNQLNTDGDSYGDECDNCITVKNGTATDNQRDTDGDGFGNVCDADYDNSGMTDSLDLVMFIASYQKSVGDPAYNEDVDCDGDGFVGFGDFFSCWRLWVGSPPGP